MQTNGYVTDRSIDIIASARGYTTNDIVYTFGKEKVKSYMAISKNGSNYGTMATKDGKNWSTLDNSTTNVPNRIMWDGLKWIVTRSDNADILYSYNAETFSTSDVSGSTMASVAYNGTGMYAGIGKGGVFFSYDGIHWINSSSGTTLINNTDTAQIGKVIWNGTLWVACGNGASYAIIYSYDGINWTGVANSKTLFDVVGGAIDVVWNGNVFVATGANANKYAIAISYDGITWTNNSSATPYFTIPT
jgi:hypothetical protein